MAINAPPGKDNLPDALEHKPAPPLPHERDESVGKAEDAPRKIIRQAKADVDSGKTATDRSEATDAAYRKQKQS